jgi:hypothetical protein
LYFFSQQESPLNIVVTNPTRPHHVNYVNPSWTKLCEYELEEISGRSLSMLEGPLSDKRSFNGLIDALNRGEVFETELINYTKSGIPMRNSIKIRPLVGIDQRIIAHVGILKFVPDQNLSAFSNKFDDQEDRTFSTADSTPDNVNMHPTSKPSIETASIPTALKSKKKKKKSDKAVHFASRIGVILIPSRSDYFSTKLNNDLWYRPDFFRAFAADALTEVRDYKEHYGHDHMTTNEILRTMYQPR